MGGRSDDHEYRRGSACPDRQDCLDSFCHDVRIQMSRSAQIREAGARPGAGSLVTGWSEVWRIEGPDFDAAGASHPPAVRDVLWLGNRSRRMVGQHGGCDHEPRCLLRIHRPHEGRTGLEPHWGSVGHQHPDADRRDYGPVCGPPYRPLRSALAGLSGWTRVRRSPDKPVLCPQHLGSARLEGSSSPSFPLPTGLWRSEGGPPPSPPPAWASGRPLGCP